MCRKVSVNFVLFLLILLGGSVQAALYSWDAGGDGVSWLDANNWSSDTIPLYANDAEIDGAGYTAVVSVSTGRPRYVFIAYNVGTGGTVTINADMTCGRSGPTYGSAYLGGYAGSTNGTLNISGAGAILNCLGGYTLKTWGTGHELNVNNGGTLLGTNYAGHITMGQDVGNPTAVTTINVDNGTIDLGGATIGSIFLGYNPGSGTHNMNMTAGLVNAADLYVTTSDNTTSHFQFDGGTVCLAGTLSITETLTQHGSMDMTGGATLLLAGSQGGLISGYFGAGVLTANGGSGFLAIDEGNINPGYTTVTVVPEPATMVLLSLGLMLIKRRQQKI